MTGSAAMLLALTAVVAVIDWIAVGSRNRRLEYVAKPLTTLGLVALAVALEPRDDAARVLFVVALVLSLAGDVLLMLPNRRRFFPFGLGSFLGAHVAYIPGLLLLGVSVGGTVAGLVVVAVGAATVGLRIVRGVRSSTPALVGPVVVYLVVIFAMLVAAWGTLLPLAMLGAALFCVSDAVLGDNEFVRPRAGSHLVVMVTYHLAQAFLVLSLVNW